MGYKIFQLDTSIRPTCESYSRRSGQHFIRKFQEKFGQLEVSYLDLTKEYFLEHFFDSMCDSNIWLWGLSADKSIIPDSINKWMNFINRKNFILNQSCKLDTMEKKAIIIANWQKENDILSPKFQVEPLIRNQLNLLGINEVNFFHLFQKDNTVSGEINLQKDINNYIANLHL